VTTRSWEFRLLFTLNVVSEGSERVAALRAARERRQGFLERFLQGVEKEQMDIQILPASEAEGLPRGPLHGPKGHRPPVYPEGRRVAGHERFTRVPAPVGTSHESPVTSCNLFSFTLLSKNVPASHLESHSCKNKGLKVPCFHTLTKKGVGEGVAQASAWVSTRSCGEGSPVTGHNSPITTGGGTHAFDYQLSTVNCAPHWGFLSPVTSHQPPITTGGGYTRFRLSTVDCQLCAARPSWEPR